MFRLALRNLLRNKRRTIITGLAISGGLMLLAAGLLGLLSRRRQDS